MARPLPRLSLYIGRSTDGPSGQARSWCGPSGKRPPTSPGSGGSFARAAPRPAPREALVARREWCEGAEGPATLGRRERRRPFPH